MLNRTPQAQRLQIAVFGRRNVGKSTLVNAITGQPISLVSEVAGTTTDPVFKSMEILPIGPVQLIDTAGIDDDGDIGSLRVSRTKRVMDRTDLALLVFAPDLRDFKLELAWFDELQARGIPVIGVLNRIDEKDVDLAPWLEYFDIPFVKVSAKENIHINELKGFIQVHAPTNYVGSSLIGDLVCPNDVVVLVAPPDLQSPKGRLKLVQVQIIRDLLDNHAIALTTTDEELAPLLAALSKAPDLVITDAKVFEKVTRMVPQNVPVTSFSMVMARHKGDLENFLAGAEAIDQLKPGDKVLIAEGCTHHALQGDIARELLPELLSQRAGGRIQVTINSGPEFPEHLEDYQLVLHCGACMLTRTQLMSRLHRAENAGVPITNFGVAIAHIKGQLDRAAGPLMRTSGTPMKVV